jgi:Short C-terminal domain
MVDGSRVVQRCLRCGAILGEAELAAAAVTAPDIDPRRRPEPQPSSLPPAPIEGRAEPDAEPPPAADGPPDADVEDSETAEESTLAALSALRELGELHAAGVLTDREFARKKAELLRRV